MENYSFKKTLLKGLKYFVIFCLPLLIDRFVVGFPEVAQITVGAGLVMLCNWAKVKLGVRIP